MRTLKILNKRHLALFLALTMLVSMPQINTVAAETNGDDTDYVSTDVNVDASADAGDINFEVVTFDDGEPAMESTSPVAEESADVTVEENSTETKAEETQNPEKPEGDDVEQESAESDDANVDGVGEAWDLTKTKRPGQTAGVKTDIGEGKKPGEGSEPGEEPGNPEEPGTGEEPSSPEEPGVGEEPEKPAEKDWTVFYDAATDTYKLNFNIKEDAQGDQVFDLTKALELLGQYADAAVKEEYPEAPVMPGKPEGLDSVTSEAFAQFAVMAEEDPTQSTVANAKDILDAILVEKKMIVEDSYLQDYLQDYAQYMMDAADYKQACADWAYFVEIGFWVGDLDSFLDWCNLVDGEPQAPEYVVDTNSQEYQVYKAELDKYNQRVAEIDLAYKIQKEANVLQPGDVRKFEIYFTSDSQHTYKYKDGSFTLATPDMKEWYGDTEKNGDVEEEEKPVLGFDDQELSGSHVGAMSVNIGATSEPIIALFEQIGVPRERSNFCDDFNDFIKGSDLTFDQRTQLLELLGCKSIKGDFSEAIVTWVINYYSKDGETYDSLEDLLTRNPDALTSLKGTSSNKPMKIDGKVFGVAMGPSYRYDNFYQSLLSFVFGDVNEINKATGEVIGTQPNGNPEYKNPSWMSENNGLMKALYYYMDHKEIWKQTDEYFNQLLDGGLIKEQATWTSFMMAINIDGRLAGNGYQITQWPWYNSIQLEQMDIDFTLEKKDSETGDTIADDETEFEVYYIDKVLNDDGSTTPVKMYCVGTKNDDDTISYSFVTTPSTVKTTGGVLNINYAMMKDIVYYLQEKKAPEGYELDPHVYIIMSEEDYSNLSEEEGAALEGTFDRFLNTTKDGLSVSADFINVRIVPTTPPDEPDTPDTPDDPDEPDTPDTPDTPDDPDTPEEPDEPTVLSDEPDEPVGEEIPDEGVPLTELSAEEVPLALTVTLPDTLEEIEPLTEILDEGVPMAQFADDELVDLFDEDVPLASVPETGDISVVWYLMIAVSGICMLGFAVIDLKKRREAMAN